MTQRPEPMFSIVTPDNSRHITLNDNRGRVRSEAMIIGEGDKCVMWAVLAYARKHHIRFCDVGYAVRPVHAGEV
jgi:hypothetical protein